MKELEESSPRVRYERYLQVLVLGYNSAAVLCNLLLHVFEAEKDMSEAVAGAGLGVCVLGVVTALWLRVRNLPALVELLCYLLFTGGYVLLWAGLYLRLGSPANLFLLSLHNGLLAVALLHLLSFYTPERSIAFSCALGAVSATSVALLGQGVQPVSILCCQAGSLLLVLGLGQCCRLKEDGAEAAWDWDEERRMLDACCVWWDVPFGLCRRCC
jgi:hypothetical protein